MKAKDFIFSKLDDGYSRKDLLGMFDLFVEETGSNGNKDSFQKEISRRVMEYYEDSDETVRENNLKLAKQKQKLTDSNRYLNKNSRELYRLLNLTEAVYTEMTAKLKKVNLSKFKIKEQPPKGCKNNAVLTLSDFHMNEIIEPGESGGNKYDFMVGSQRLKMLVSKSIEHFKFNNVGHVHINLAGDLLNSSRRLDEQMMQVSSLVNASLATVSIIEQAILELGKHFKVSVSAVVGNESRMFDEMTNTDITLQENFDYLVFKTLKKIFEKTNVTFIDRDPRELVVQLGNKTFLFIHGDQIKGKIETYVQNVIGRYAVNHKIHLDHVVFGHRHHHVSTDYFTQNGALCGSNSYSTRSLNLYGKASQSIIIFNDTDLFSLPIYVQDGYEEFKGYDIPEEFKNVRSYTPKLKGDEEVIVKVVV